MGVVAWETEYASPVPAARFFKALVLEPEHHLPKISPDSFKSIEILEGDGGPGTIKKVNYVIDGQAVNLKYKIEELDKVNLKTSYTCIESYFPADKVEKICFTMTFVPSEAEGSICKNTGKVYTKADFEFPKEQYIAQGKAHLKSIEEYLLAHSDVCN